MKAEEAIRALAFMSNPEELTTTNESFKEDAFVGIGVRGRIVKRLSTLISEKSLDLYSIRDLEDNGGASSSKNNNKDNNNQQGTASTTSSSDADNKGVSFGIVEVRKYPITIGLNPSVSRGVPCTIEWDHIAEETERHHINAYERERPNEERKRGEELLLDGITRAKMLRDLGYTKTELMEGIRRAREHSQYPPSQAQLQAQAASQVQTKSQASSRAKPAPKQQPPQTAKTRRTSQNSRRKKQEQGSTTRRGSLKRGSKR